MSIVEFLEARIAEDEAVARQSRNPVFDDDYDGVANRDEVQRGSDRWDIQPHGRDCGWRLGEGMQLDCTCMWPSRVLAECVAKRAILDLWAEANGYASDGDLSGTIAVTAYCYALRAIALPYAGHPDYRQEWRP